jgi:hypothetical protein
VPHPETALIFASVAFAATAIMCRKAMPLRKTGVGLSNVGQSSQEAPAPADVLELGVTAEIPRRGSDIATAG